MGGNSENTTNGGAENFNNFDERWFVREKKVVYEEKQAVNEKSGRRLVSVKTKIGDW